MGLLQPWEAWPRKVVPFRPHEQLALSEAVISLRSAGAASGRQGTSGVSLGRLPLHLSVQEMLTLGPEAIYSHLPTHPPAHMFNGTKTPLQQVSDSGCPHPASPPTMWCSKQPRCLAWGQCRLGGRACWRKQPGPRPH